MKIGERLRGHTFDLIAVASCLVFAVVLLMHLWQDPRTRMLSDNNQDQIFFEWVLTHAAHAVSHGESPIFTDELNAPLGVNLMANTSILGLAVPLSPVTLLFGAGVTFAIISTLALAGTAVAWYFVLSRDVVSSKAAAYVGALFCGFGPAMVSQVTGHPNIAGQFLIPFIVRMVIRLREPGPAVRRGLGLAALVVYQCFINEEILFLTACALAVFLVAYLPPREMLPAARAALPTLGVTALAAGAVLAYPLWHQFAGPQAYHGLPEFVRGFSSDLGSFTEFSRRSIVGDPARIEKMGGATEENTFFGWPLLGLLVAVAVAMWRHRAARALVITTVVFGILSLGGVVRYEGEETTWHGPWQWLDDLPLFDSVVPTRLALVMTPLVGVLIALVVEQFIDRRPEPVGEESGPARPAAPILWAVALTVALVPLVPTPQPASDRAPVPVFFSSGQWREHLPKSATVVAVPGGWWEQLDAMRWATTADLDFKIVGGYFLAPDPNHPERHAMFGPSYPPTLSLLSGVANDGAVPQVTPDQQAQARTDVDYWGATTVVLADRHGNSEAVRRTVDQLFGPGRHVSDVWLWDVR
ncbi:hypothetical protein Drose_22985 [Dactylosporangium roseum]|uniref:DUF6311 domain-containing protein n=1 Tax=Dactylosporangium roseum TaxID=47989 RepID=A0ABY5YWJ4_9ACTN|nr:hypothetical protein [Dactylosporangium roseum]UWZ34115.1 hypothetical protein Drose_22985 [Dactylosporangium roseum]